MKVRLSKASISELEKQAVISVMDKEYLGMGSETQAFEADIANYLGVTSDNVATVNTGTSALHIALSALGIGLGDEVIVPSLTYVASFQAISELGATPIPCEVKADSLFVDAKDIESKITPNTKAIMPVHYASSARGLNDVYELAKKHRLRVVEDAAQAFGCLYEGKPVGSFGDIICFSFDGIKNITCGEGGAVVSQDSKLMDKIRDIRLLGVHKDTDKRYSGERSWDFDVFEQGYRYHLSNLNAAIGRVQLTRLEAFKKVRKKIANTYCSTLKNIPEINLLDIDFDEVSPHIFVILAERRDELRSHLLNKGVEVGIHYKPNHLLTKYRSDGKLPTTEELYSRVLSLPCHVDLTSEEQAYVIEQVIDFYR